MARVAWVALVTMRNGIGDSGRKGGNGGNDSKEGKGDIGGIGSIISVSHLQPDLRHTYIHT